MFFYKLKYFDNVFIRIYITDKMIFWNAADLVRNVNPAIEWMDYEIGAAVQCILTDQAKIYLHQKDPPGDLILTMQDGLQFVRKASEDSFLYSFMQTILKSPMRLVGKDTLEQCPSGDIILESLVDEKNLYPMPWRDDICLEDELDRITIC